MSASSQPPPDDRSARRQAILQAATRLFAEHGFRPTTMQAVAAAAGVSVGYLYKHFDGKDAMLAAILDQHLQRMDQLIAEVQARGLSPLAELRGTLEAICDHFNAHRHFMRVYHDNLELAVLQSEDRRHGHHRQLAALLQRARDAGEISDTDVELLASAVHGASRELFFTLADRPGEAPFSSLPDHLFRLLIDPQRP